MSRRLDRADAEFEDAQYARERYAQERRQAMGLNRHVPVPGYHWADCADGCSWEAHRVHQADALTAAEFADQIADVQAAVAASITADEIVATVQVPNPLHWRETYAAVMGEPLGLPGRELDKTAPVGVAQPGCCKVCLTGPVYDQPAGLCLYCWTQAELAGQAFSAFAAGPEPEESLAWITAGHIKHCKCHLCQLVRYRKYTVILGGILMLAVVWIVTGALMGA